MRCGQSDIKLLMGRVLKVTQPVGCRTNAKWTPSGRRVQLDGILFLTMKWCSDQLPLRAFVFIAVKLWTEKLSLMSWMTVLWWHYEDSVRLFRNILLFFLWPFLTCVNVFHCDFIRRCCLDYDVVEHVSLSLFQPSYLSNVCWTENWYGYVSDTLHRTYLLPHGHDNASHEPVTVHWDKQVLTFSCFI